MGAEKTVERVLRGTADASTRFVPVAGTPMRKFAYTAYRSLWSRLGMDSLRLQPVTEPRPQGAVASSQRELSQVGTRFREARTGQSSLVPEKWRGGEDKFAESRYQREAVPGQAGPGGDSEGKAWFYTMIKYEVIIYWSEEDRAFVAEVPELPGCVAHGDSQESALASAQEAIRLWIDTAKEFGDPIPEPKGRRLLLA